MGSLVKNRRIKVGLVGCGRIAKSHFEAIDFYKEDLELVAVCDVLAHVKSKYCESQNVRGYLGLKEMLSEESLDLLVLCTPSGLHAEQAIMGAKFGINIITEKPMATRCSDALKMVKACDEAGVHLFVVKQNRKNETLQYLKRAVQQKRFGKINLVNLNVFWQRSQEYYDQAQWRGTWEFDGGALMNQASHYVDLLTWLIGPVQSVHAMASTTRDIEAEDTAVLNIQWRNGAVGSVNVTMLTYPKNLEGSITILGEKGSAKVGGVAVNEIQHWEFDVDEVEDAQIRAYSYQPTTVYGYGHRLYYQNVIDVMRGIAAPDTDGRDGLRSLEVLVAAYRSAKSAKQVNLPLGL